MSTSADFRRLAARTPHGAIASGLGSGLAPVAPGTVASFVALPAAWLLLQLHPLTQALVIVAAFGLGIWACGRSAKALGVHDYGGIVWDEFVGMWVSLWALPPVWWVLVCGFVLFRFFDIVKPPPIRWLDRSVAGGLGIMIDDVLAAVYAWTALYGIVYWVSR